MNQIPNIEETNTREIEDKLEKLESIILLRVDRLFFEGTVILLKDYKETLAQQIRAELHHQLQKAQQHEQEMYESLDANYQLMLQKVREESVKALKVADNDIPPFPSAKDSESARIGFITGVAWARTRLHSELDQDNLTN